MSKTTENGASTATGEIVEQLLKPENQEALGVLLENLPKLAEMSTLLTRFYDIAQSVATDEVLMNDLKQGFNEFLTPVQQKAKAVAANLIEANDRAQTSRQEIGIFGLLKMMKHPEVQKVFRFAQAYLDVVSERK